MENKNRSVNEEAQKEYVNNFMPSVHRIGRATMALSFILAFLPVVFFIVVKGYTAPISSYVAVAIAVSGIGLGSWVSEPLAYWPVLGSAGTYMGYLSGNVGAQRFPVALNVQSAMNAPIGTPRGQMATIIGIVASVFSNLVLLLVFILGGDWVLQYLPEVVMASFAFVMIGLLASILIMMCYGQDGIAKGFMQKLPYIVLTIVCKLILDRIPALVAWGMAIDVVLCIALGYVLYKKDCKKDEAAN